MVTVIKFSHKGLDGDERAAELAKFVKHPAWPRYTQFFQDTYDENAADVAYADCTHIIRLQDWDKTTGCEPKEGLIHPRYEKIIGRQTFYPFPDWLSQNAHDLATKGIEVVLDYDDGSVVSNMPEKPDVMKYQL